MAVMYCHLSYEDYKSLANQMREFNETTHTSSGGFYHKSVRLHVSGDLSMEFHGPLIGGIGHHEGPDPC